ncbi:hypothetical protein BG004_006901 [Podila humilis]|nr:hypothetical protein BG004_006901 [Podila humilis]
MVPSSARKAIIISVSAIVGITTLSTLAYLLIQDDKKAQHQRKIRALQKSLGSRLHKVDADVDALLEGDIRLAHVRVNSLHGRSIYPEGHHSNGKEQLDQALVLEQPLTAEESQRELALGLEDPAKVRQAYKRLDFLINSVNERLLRLLEALDGISPRELTDLGDGFGGLAPAQGFEATAFEKVRKRKRAAIARIQKIMGDMDKVGANIKGRVSATEVFEVEEAERKAKEAEEKKEEERQAQAAKDAQEKEEAETRAKAEAEAKIKREEERKHRIEILAPTDDLAVMKEGVTFAEMAKHQADKEEITETSTEELSVAANAEVASSSSVASSYAEINGVSESAVLVEPEEQEQDTESIQAEIPEVAEDH